MRKHTTMLTGHGGSIPSQHIQDGIPTSWNTLTSASSREWRKPDGARENEMKTNTTVLTAITALLVLLMAGSAMCATPEIVMFQENGVVMDASGEPILVDGHGTGFVAPSYPGASDFITEMPDTMMGMQALTAWDWRVNNGTTTAKDQGSCGSCWDFATVGSMESFVYINSGTAYDLSEEQVKECSTYDGCTYGGNAWMAINVLTNPGSVLEVDDPYFPTDGSCDTTTTPVERVTDWYTICGGVIPSNDLLKNYIRNTGPIYTTIDADCLSGYDGSYVINGTYLGGNTHAVLIVGWDDTMAHDHGNGAWIVKNSWGTGFGDDGYFYIAYGCAGMGMHSSVVSGCESYESYVRTMSYDEGGCNGVCGYGSTEAWGLCKYDVPVGEIVTDIEFWTIDSTSSVDLYLYDDFDGNARGTPIYSVSTGGFDNPGYHSVEVGEPIVSTTGTIVVAARIVDNLQTLPIVVDNYGDIEVGKTYMSKTGDDNSWTDMGTWCNGVDVALRIRVSTGDPVCTDVVISTGDSTDVEVGEDVSFIVDCTDQYGDDIDCGSVAWYSSNVTVGTIDGNGLFTSHSAGTSDVTAEACGTSNAITVSVSLQPPVCDSVEISADTPDTVDIGETVTFSATCEDQYDNPIDCSVLTWNSDNVSVGTADSGVFTTIAPGTANITATGCGDSNAIMVTVREVRVCTNVVIGTDDSVDIWVGDIVSFYANCTDQYGDSIDCASLSWESDNTSVGTMSVNVLTGIMDGTTNVIASACEDSDSMQVNVTVPYPSCVLVEIDTGDPTEVSVGDIVTFTTTCQNYGGEIAECPELVWRSDNDAVGTVSNAVFTAVEEGTANVVAIGCGRSNEIMVTVTNGDPDPDPVPHYDSNVTLENKVGHPDWSIIDDGISALIEYNSTGDEFEWRAVGVASLNDTEYVLIYYADKPDRHNVWGGNNPGAYIGTIVTGSDGSFDVSNSTDLGINLPEEPDFNELPEPWDEYCNESGPDGYDNCCGAKLWMVPAIRYNIGNRELISWTNINHFLFETDLIWYDDTDYHIEPSVMETSVNVSVASAGDIVLVGAIVRDGDGIYDLENMVVTANMSVYGVDEIVVLEYVGMYGCIDASYEIDVLVTKSTPVDTEFVIVAEDPSGANDSLEASLDVSPGECAYMQLHNMECDGSDAYDEPLRTVALTQLANCNTRDYTNWWGHGYIFDVYMIRYSVQVYDEFGNYIDEIDDADDCCNGFTATVTGVDASLKYPTGRDSNIVIVNENDPGKTTLTVNCVDGDLPAITQEVEFLMPISDPVVVTSDATMIYEDDYYGESEIINVSAQIVDYLGNPILMPRVGVSLYVDNACECEVATNDDGIALFVGIDMSGYEAGDNVTFRAEAECKEGSLILPVVEQVLASVEVVSDSHVECGDEQQLTYTCYNPNGGDMFCDNGTWSCNDFGEINETTGYFTAGDDAGIAVVEVNVSGVIGTAEIVVDGEKTCNTTVVAGTPFTVTSSGVSISGNFTDDGGFACLKVRGDPIPEFDNDTIGAIVDASENVTLDFNGTGDMWVCNETTGNWTEYATGDTAEVPSGRGMYALVYDEPVPDPDPEPTPTATRRRSSGSSSGGLYLPTPTPTATPVDDMNETIVVEDDDADTSETMPVNDTEVEDDTEKPTPTKDSPGFGGVFVIAGVLAIAYLIGRKRE